MEQHIQTLHRKKFATTLSGDELTLEVSELAKQANGAVIATHGETVVLATATLGPSNRVTDYFPLTVDYEERFYATGKILGSRFVRREGRPSEEGTLSARLIDRTIRPLFDQRLRSEVHVVATILAYDGTHDPDPVALIAASAALAISDIPWGGPVAGIRTERRGANGEVEFISFFAGTSDRVNMIEFEGNERLEAEALELFQAAQTEIRRLTSFQREMVAAVGKPKTSPTRAEPNPEFAAKVRTLITTRLNEAYTKQSNEALHDASGQIRMKLVEEGESAENLAELPEIIEAETDAYVHRRAVTDGVRMDGRAFDEIRPLGAEVGLLARTHGSGLFMRGDTQVLAVVTLASPEGEQLVESMEGKTKRRFMLHYNFPSFATGEPGRSRSPGRREIGHGALAHKALKWVLPPKETFPYTIRIVCETLSSNGSSSMASTCAGCLALMDAGVPIRKPVAGIAMGLMTHGDDYRVLTDIQGLEDHFGGMDFKVAGTMDGVTAIQLDMKVDGLTEPMFEEALAKAHDARLKILEVMRATLPAPRAALSPYAPTILTMPIDPSRIGEVIGPGGKVINGIIAAAGGNITIDIEDEGKVYVGGTDRAMVEWAFQEIKNILREFTIGEVVEGDVVKMLDFGAIIDLGAGRDGMLHVSELREGFVKQVTDVVNMGDHVRVKIIRADPDGRIGLSLKQMGKGE
ncbi:MAG: polyribonucleotide nucleotidyltransferase [bacterium]|nr:polyribonucleotide nucleotidyltransferase [bacterium]